MEQEKETLTDVSGPASDARLRTIAEQLSETKEELLENEVEMLELQVAVTRRVTLWTDDFSNLLDVLSD